jgi:hypothetical protein
MAKLDDLTVPELETKRRQLALMQMGIGTLGMVAGFVYANKTGGHFWRYVGFGLMGSIAAGSIGYFTTYQRIAKIETKLGTKE